MLSYSFSHSYVIFSPYTSSSVQFHCTVISESLWPHGLQHARLPWYQLLELTQTHVHQVSDSSTHLILCGSLLLQPSIFLSIRVFSKVSVLRIRWPKYWSLSFGISPSNEYSGLISCRIDWFYLLAAQGTLKSLLHIELWCSQFKSINSLVLGPLYSPNKVPTH